MDSQMNLFDASADYYDEKITQNQLNELNFRVHASIIYKLGESLIADEITALSELIKNAYDADASYCKLLVDSAYVDENGAIGKIEINDNGCGMSLQTIINGWLTISNSQKKKMKKENQTTPKFKRIPLGEKGLGRLSVQKLGAKVVLLTKEKESDFETELTISWGEFLKNTTLDQIPLQCKQRKVKNEKSYTSVTIVGLINPNFWASEEVKVDLEKTINQIISPFRFHDNKFIITAEINGFKIDINNAIFRDILQTARSKYMFTVKQDFVELKCSYKIDFFKKRKTRTDFPWFDFSKDYFVELFDLLQEKFDDLKWCDDGHGLYEITYRIPLRSIATLKRDLIGNLYYPGDFDGAIYDFSYENQYISQLMQSYDFSYALKEQEYKAYIKSNNGIKVLRDGFVVQGYGDGSVDWLKISTQATTSGRYLNLKNENLIGYVKLTGQYNQSLKETTSREGFINDEYYQNFYSLIRECVIKNINKANDELDKIFKKYLNGLIVEQNQELDAPINNLERVAQKATQLSTEVTYYVASARLRLEEKKRKAHESQKQTTFFENEDQYQCLKEVVELQDQVIAGLEDKLAAVLSEVASLKNSSDIIHNDFQTFNQRTADVFELAGLGIAVELFTHEMYTTINNVNEKLVRFKKMDSELNYVSNAMNSLRKQIAYFYPGLKVVRSTKTMFTLNELILDHVNFYEQQAALKEIHFVVMLQNKSDVINTNRGLLNQVLDNLFSNAVYWLVYTRDKLQSISECEYNIVINDNYTIDVWDNGIGIAQDIERELFNPFVSHKENGRGLGLFICKQNLENNNASIRLLRERNQFDNLYKFRIDLSNLIAREVK